MPPTLAKAIENSDFAREVPSHVRDALFAASMRVELEANEPLFFEGDPANDFFILLEGNLKATKLSPEGDEQIIAVFRAGELFGEMAHFDGAARSATISAVKKATMMSWPHTEFFRVANEAPELYRFVLGVLSRRLRETNIAFAARQFLPLKGQLAVLLSRLKRDLGIEWGDGSTRIDIRLTQADLATMIGASRENVSRVLNEWIREGTLAKVDGRYHIVRADQLDAHAERHDALA